MRWPWQKVQQIEKKAQFEDVLRRLVMSQEGTLGKIVTPDNCMQSPTVHAIVTAVSRRLATTPIHIYEKTTSNGLDSKQPLPNHPVAKLLKRPNGWQSDYEFWQDATSVFLRWGRFYAYKSRGSTGPIRELIPLDPGAVDVKQDPDNYRVSFRVSSGKGITKDLSVDKMFTARGPARDFLTGDSPVSDVSTAIALEILAEKFGANFFKNGAIPLLVFEYMEGAAGFETVEQEKQFMLDLKEALGGDKQLNSMLMPKGISKPSPVNMEHDKAQFLETRKYQRTVIAGAFGVPPTIAGDLERATFNNVEQMSKDFTENVILPIARAFECAMERDLLTIADRNNGLVVRFNLDATLRASFKDRQEGLQIQRSNGIISANEWREIEGKNPRQDDEGDDYMHPGNMLVDGEEPNETIPDSTFGDQTPAEPGV